VTTEGSFPPKLGDAEFKRLAHFIQDSVGIKMPSHKQGMLELRLGKRVRALGLDSFEEYCAHLFDTKEPVPEFSELLDAVTTNKTDFFREPEHFGRLLHHVLPEAISADPSLSKGRPYRVWSAGCSSGEEPYTLAMVLQEFSGANPGFSFEITATDLSANMLRVAHKGIYPAERVSVVPPGYMKYLMRSKDRSRDLVRVVPKLREKVSFARVNLKDRLPFAHQFDLVVCRNVLIYFDREGQIDTLSRIGDLLIDGGYLFVGHSETLHGMELPLRQVVPTVYQRMDRW